MGGVAGGRGARSRAVRAGGPKKQPHQHASCCCWLAAPPLPGVLAPVRSSRQRAQCAGASRRAARQAPATRSRQGRDATIPTASQQQLHACCSRIRRPPAGRSHAPGMLRRQPSGGAAGAPVSGRRLVPALAPTSNGISSSQLGLLSGIITSARTCRPPAWLPGGAWLLIRAACVDRLLLARRRQQNKSMPAAHRRRRRPAKEARSDEHQQQRSAQGGAARMEAIMAGCLQAGHTTIYYIQACSS